LNHPASVLVNYLKFKLNWVSCILFSWCWGLSLARQALHPLSHAPSPEATDILSILAGVGMVETALGVARGEVLGSGRVLWQGGLACLGLQPCACSYGHSALEDDDQGNRIA
jgi:hypothetical protein